MQICAKKGWHIYCFVSFHLRLICVRNHRSDLSYSYFRMNVACITFFFKRKILCEKFCVHLSDDNSCNTSFGHVTLTVKREMALIMCVFSSCPFFYQIHNPMPFIWHVGVENGWHITGVKYKRHDRRFVRVFEIRRFFLDSKIWEVFSLKRHTHFLRWTTPFWSYYIWACSVILNYIFAIKRIEECFTRS